MKKGEEYIAAIEVNGRYVKQARGYENDDIDEDEEVYEAFEKWLSKFNLCWKEAGDGPYNAELPF